MVHPLGRSSGRIEVSRVYTDEDKSPHFPLSEVRARVAYMGPVPSLSKSALQELRRIYCKHLLEVFASEETQELYERGCIAGRFDEKAFIVEAVTPVGRAVLEEHDAPREQTA